MSQRSSEVDELQKQMRVSRFQELQMQTALLQDECVRLRHVSEKAVSILIKYGLDSHLKKSRKL